MINIDSKFSFPRMSLGFWTKQCTPLLVSILYFGGGVRYFTQKPYFPFFCVFTYLFIVCLWLFCYNCNETRRVELLNSRNPRISHKFDEVDSRIESSISIYYSLFIVHPKYLMMSLPFKHPSKAPGSCVRVIEKILGSHKIVHTFLHH